MVKFFFNEDVAIKKLKKTLKLCMVILCVSRYSNLARFLKVYYRNSWSMESNTQEVVDVVGLKWHKNGSLNSNKIRTRTNVIEIMIFQMIEDSNVQFRSLDFLLFNYKVILLFYTTVRESVNPFVVVVSVISPDVEHNFC